MLAPFAFIVADLLIYWSGFEVVWKLGIVLIIGYVIIGAFMAFQGVTLYPFGLTTAAGSGPPGHPAPDLPPGPGGGDRCLWSYSAWLRSAGILQPSWTRSAS